MKRNVLLAVVTFTLVLGIIEPAVSGGPSGRDIFYGASPSCVACHNARRGDLAYSRVTTAAVRHVVRNGVPGQMPAYRFSEAELDALVKYLLSIRR